MQVLMNALFIIEGRYPTPQASSKRLTNYIKALQREQDEVGIFPIFIASKSRLLTYFYSGLVPLWAFWTIFTKANPYNVVFVYGFGWIGKLLIAFASKLKRKPVCLEINEKPYSIHGSRRDLILKYIEPFHEFCLTRFVYPMVEGFIVISDGLFKDIEKYKKNKAIILKVPILVDFDYYQKAIQKPKFISPYILHSATLNDHKDGIINVFKAYSKIVTERQLDLDFYLTSNIGLPKVKEQIDEIIRDYQLEKRVHFLGDLDEENLLSYQAYCTMVVINKVDCQQNRYNFATRLGEYLSLGKPVITTRIGEVANFLKNNISCIYSDPSNPDDIANSMLRILDTPAFGKKIGDYGKKIAEKEFNYSTRSKALSQFFSNLSSN